MTIKKVILKHLAPGILIDIFLFPFSLLANALLIMVVSSHMPVSLSLVHGFPFVYSDTMMKDHKRYLARVLLSKIIYYWG